MFEGALHIHLVNRHQESSRVSFVFSGTDYLDNIEVDGQRVGSFDYGINPLGDRLYNMPKNDVTRQSWAST